MSRGPRFAYAFYATCDEYAIAVLVAVHQLIQLGSQDGIDFVVLHLPLSQSILSRMHAMGIKTRRVEPLPHTHGQYFRDCLVKFRVFQLVQYSRIVFMDADTLPLGEIDPVFSHDFNQDIAAPDAYWLEEPCVSSAFLLVKPSVQLWNRVQKHFDSAAKNRLYDMDILNIEFKDEIAPLPPDYLCLDSEWVEKDGKFCFGDPQETYNRVKLVHFSAFTKPWYFHPKKLRRLCPDAHPIFYELWDTWWKVRNEILPESTREKITRYIRETRQSLRSVLRKASTDQ